MPTVFFVTPDGSRQEVQATVGHSVMETARAAGIDGIVAECGGACACSTCHVFVDEDWQDRVPPIETMEEDMLDFAPGVVPGASRLSCQIRVSLELDGLTVRVPEEQA